AAWIPAWAPTAYTTMPGRRTCSSSAVTSGSYASQNTMSRGSSCRPISDARPAYGPMKHVRVVPWRNQTFRANCVTQLVIPFLSCLSCRASCDDKTFARTSLRYEGSDISASPSLSADRPKAGDEAPGPRESDATVFTCWVCSERERVNQELAAEVPHGGQVVRNTSQSLGEA